MACTDPAAIEFARRTGHARILEQLDPDHPDYDPRYGPLVASLVAGGPPTPPPPRFEPFPSELVERIRACPDRVSPSCGCSLPECLKGKGNPWHLVTLEDCRACLNQTPKDPPPCDER